MAEQSQDIDALLDEVAMAMVNGDNIAAKNLLSVIMAGGDDIQRQMAESYQMQLDVLIAMEQEQAVNDDAEKQSITEPNLLRGATELDSDEDLAAAFIHDEGTEYIASHAEMAKPETEENEHLVTVSTEMMTDDMGVEEIPVIADEAIVPTEEVDLSKVDQLVDVGHVDDTSYLDTVAVIDEHILAKSDNPNFNADTTNPVKANEMTVTLEQVSILLKDKAYRRAKILAQMVLDSGDAEHQQMARDYLHIIQQLSEPSEASANSDEMVVDNPINDEMVGSTSVLDKAVAETPSAVDSYQASEVVQDAQSFSEDAEQNFVQRTLDDFFASPFGDDPVVETEVLSDKPVEAQVQYDDDDTTELLSVAEQITPRDVDVSKTPNNDHNKQVGITDNSLVNESHASPVNELPLSELPVSDPVTEALPVSSHEMESPETADQLIPVSTTESTAGLLAPQHALQELAVSDAIQLPISDSAALQQHRLQQRQGFFIGHVGLMIHFADGSELTEVPRYFRVPNAPSWLLGLTNLHGVVIPIFDLANFLHLAASPQQQRMLLVLEHDEQTLGVVINGLPKRLQWRDDGQQVENNTSPERLSPYVDATYLIDKQLWFDLNSKSLAAALARSMQAA